MAACSATETDKGVVHRSQLMTAYDPLQVARLARNSGTSKSVLYFDMLIEDSQREQQVQYVGRHPLAVEFCCANDHKRSVWSPHVSLCGLAGRAVAL